MIHGWRTEVAELTGGTPPPTVEDFRRQTRDLYIPAGETGFWQGAVRDRDDPAYASCARAAENGRRVMVDLLYGDYEGGQRTITRFGINRGDEAAATGPRCSATGTLIETIRDNAKRIGDPAVNSSWRLRDGCQSASSALRTIGR